MAEDITEVDDSQLLISQEAATAIDVELDMEKGHPRESQIAYLAVVCSEMAPNQEPITTDELVAELDKRRNGEDSHYEAADLDHPEFKAAGSSGVNHTKLVGMAVGDARMLVASSFMEGLRRDGKDDLPEVTEMWELYLKECVEEDEVGAEVRIANALAPVSRGVSWDHSSGSIPQYAVVSAAYTERTLADMEQALTVNRPE
ncbi:hypothetical protein ACFL2C_03880 [Patescibacteria group bacterium]